MKKGEKILFCLSYRVSDGLDSPLQMFRMERLSYAKDMYLSVLPVQKKKGK